MINKKSKIWIRILVGVLIIGLVASMFIPKQTEYFNKVSFTDNNKVMNRSHKNYLDTIVRAGLHSMKIDNVVVLVVPLQRRSIGDYELKGAIVKVDLGYVISIKNTNRTESIEIIAHELIHLKQYNNKDLLVTNEGVTYFDIFYSFEFFPPYEDRSWEIEAFSKQSLVIEDINDILYN